MTMQNPELMLKDLNRALQHLRGACADIGDEEIDEKLLEVMRRLLLAEVLGNTWILAMGGSQGAGKTTLMASLYDLRGDGPNWLQSNEGRGEQMPVLIQEVEGLQAPQGYVRKLAKDGLSNNYKLVDTPVDITSFQSAICAPHPEELLPVLQVPAQFFTRPNQAWLLLPGYEKQDRSNRSWQELMRQAMIAAGGCIIVTDETRMANQQQLEIAKDMLENELAGIKPYIVVSKTEAHRQNAKRLADLRASAQATFQVPPELAETHIIFSGTDDANYMREWLPLLRKAIKDLNNAGDANRAAQLNQLSEIVGKDLARVLNAIRSKAKVFFGTDRSGNGNGAEVLEEALENFDDAVDDLREEHKKAVEKLVGQAFSNASAAMDDRLSAEYEGFRNKLSTVLDTTTEAKLKMQELVQHSWKQAAPRLFEDYAKSLGQLTLEKLGRQTHTASPQTPKALSEASQRRIQLGYAQASGAAVEFKQLTKDRVNDVNILLRRDTDDVRQAKDGLSKDFANSVKLIPALSMEFGRLFYAFPEVLIVKHGDSEASTVQPDIAEKGIDALNAGVELGRTALKSLATLLAVDVASDGDSDILESLFGRSPQHEQPNAENPGESSPPTATSLPLPPVPVFHPVAIGAMAAVAAAVIAVRAITGLRALEKSHSAQAYQMLSAIHDQHLVHLNRQFDETMQASRTRIKEVIRTRYKMDETLMRKDRLAKAVAEVMSITSDLRYELGASATGLQLLATTRAA